MLLIQAIIVEWYWKLSPYILYGIGDTIVNVLLLEFIIAQSPDKMKGLVMGIVIVLVALSTLLILSLYSSLCVMTCQYH